MNGTPPSRTVFQNGALSLVVASVQGSLDQNTRTGYRVHSRPACRSPSNMPTCSPEVGINPRIGHVVVQLCHPRRAPNRVTHFCEQTDVVGLSLLSIERSRTKC
jgi:hypothetical protein